MTKQSQAWKALEKKTAEVLGGERISRADDWGRSDYDVHVPAHPYLKVDCKYRKGGFAHHSLLDEIREKYVKEEGDMAILVSKSGRKRGEVVSLSLKDFARLLSRCRKSGGYQLNGWPEIEEQWMRRLKDEQDD